MSWDAIVVGSGVGGLTAAAYLAANDRRVLVLEAQGVIEQFPGEADGIRAVLATLRQVGRATEEVGIPVRPTLIELLRGASALPPLLRHGAGSLQALFDKHGLSDKARLAVGYICLFVLLPFETTPVAVYAFALNHYIKSGGWYVRGGVGKIPNSLARVVRSHGGEVRTRTRVEKILVDRGRVEGVRLSTGEVLGAPVVISNADIKTLYATLLDPKDSSWLRRKHIERAKLTPTLFSVYLGVDVDLNDHLPAKHFFVLPHSDPGELLRKVELGSEAFDLNDLPVWITSATLKDTPRAGTQGYSTLELTTGTPQNYEFWGLEGGVLDGVDYHRKPSYLARKREIEEALVRSTLELLPFLRGHIVWQESSTMLSHEKWTLTRHGAWAGLDFSVANMVFRPGPGTPVTGLFIAGASSNGGGAMLGTLRGGVETASAVLGRNLWREVRAGAVFGHGLQDKGFDPGGPVPGFHRLRVANVERHTLDSVTIEFAVPRELRESFAFIPGQHLTIRGESRGEPVRRSYSICEPISSNRLRIAVKHVPGGVFSTHALTRLRAGDVLTVAPPRGSFVAGIGSGVSRAAVVAGSGITPVFSIAATALETEPDSTFTLWYGNRTRDTVMFDVELARLAHRFPGRLRIEHFLSRDTDPGPGYRSRRIDRTALAELPEAQEWFLCGPKDLVHTVRDVLHSNGIDPASVRLELFDDAPLLGGVSTVDSRARSAVRLILAGVTEEFSMSQAEPILDAAMRIRDDLPYSCQSGSCGTCRAKLCAGKVEVADAEDMALTDTDMRDGYVLTCLAYPRSDDVTVDYDA